MVYLSDLLLRRDVLRVVVEDVHDAGGGGGGCGHRGGFCEIE